MVRKDLQNTKAKHKGAVVENASKSTTAAFFAFAAAAAALAATLGGIVRWPDRAPTSFPTTTLNGLHKTAHGGNDGDGGSGGNRRVVEEVWSAAVRKGGFSAADVADILAVEKQVWADSENYPHLSNQSRVFGEKSNDDDASKGHSATYLQAHVGKTEKGRALMAKLLRLTMEVEEEAGWGIVSSGLFQQPLHHRAAESIRYTQDEEGGEGGAGAGAGAGTAEIGWHSDFMSVMTVSVMLSPSLAFSGGAFQTRRLGPADGSQSYELDAGDVTVWKSWDRHRVEPLVGNRHVFVVQWWLAPQHSSPAHGPASNHYFLEGPDLLLPYCKAIQTIDPTSFYAAQICGKYLAKVAANVQDPLQASRLLQSSLGYHTHASEIANAASSAMLRQPLLSSAERLCRIHFARGVRPELKHIHRVLKVCEQVHTLGAALPPGMFETEMAKDMAPVGQQKDIGGTVLRMLKQVIAVKELNLGSHSDFEQAYPFLKLYWSPHP